MDVLGLLSPLFFLLAGCGALIGIFFGAIPGMTATMAVAVCLPLTYVLGLHEGLALLLGLYVGGISGGMLPAVLLNIPGTPSSITTTFDGYPLAKQGKAFHALYVCIFASLFGGVFSAIILYFFAPALSDVAIKFSYVEKFLVILFALSVIASLSKRPIIGVVSGLVGVLLSLVGAYDIAKGGNGEVRLLFDFMTPYLESGFSLLPVLIGLFGITTLLKVAVRSRSELNPDNVSSLPHTLASQTRFRLSYASFKYHLPNALRSSSIGTFVGMLPGIGGSAASVLAYSQQKNFSRQPELMGSGRSEGLVASESANNSLTGGALIPLLSLGIPGDSTTAILIGAFTLHGIQVGPLFIGEHVQTWQAMLIALVFANLIMFCCLFFALKYIVRILSVPTYILYPIILLMCVVGAYAINYGIMFDVWTLLIFGLFGLVAEKIGIEIAPLVIGFILGSPAEIYFVKSLESYGDLSIFFTKSPIAILLWLLIFGSVLYSILSHRRASNRKRARSPGS